MKTISIFQFSITVILSSIITIPAYASHIVGGELTYSFLSYNSTQTEVSYQVTMNLYRDPLGIDFPVQVDFGIFIEDELGLWSSYKVAERVPISSLDIIVPQTDPCKTSFLSDNELQAATYSFEVTLEVSDHNYMIAYQACCRNFAINNVMSSGDIGAVYDIVITPEAQRLANNSPTYNAIPPQFVCANFDVNVDHSATDADGDSLVYKFCVPLSPGINDNSAPDCCGCVTPNPYRCTPPYDELVFINGFSASEPMGGDPVVAIDAQSGLINGIPSDQGAYVVAVCVEEYRDGVLLSSVRRDFQFIVIVCNENLQASVAADNYISTPDTNQEIAYYESCGELTQDIINLSTDEIYIQDYNWQIFDADDNLIYAEEGLNSRDVQITFPSHGLYSGYMILNDGATCYDTAFMQFNIAEDINLSFEIDYDTCLAGPVQFLNTSTPEDIEYNWSLGDGSSISNYSTDHIYPDRGTYDISLIAIDSIGCTDTLYRSVDWYPIQLVAPDTIKIDSLLCYHDSIFIYDNWVYNSGVYYNYLPFENSSCDSIVEAYFVEFTPAILTTRMEIDICDGESYTFQNRPLSVSGLYSDTLISVDGCDSIVELQLLALEHTESYINENICEGDSYIFDNDSLVLSGLYIDTLLNANNCDSIILLELNVKINSTTEIDISICENDFYLYQNDTLRTENNYQYIMQDLDGCDSIINLNVVTRPISQYNYIDTICDGDTYDFGGRSLDFEGIYYDTLTNVYGCDSIIILDLIVGKNLSRIDLDSPLEEYYGTTITLTPEVIGEELVTYIWYETDDILANTLSLDYLLEDDSWIFFESTNELYCAAIDSIYLKAIIDKQVYIPNVISPNGDGFNDRFYLGASSTLAASRLTIYDRWGNLMFQNEKTFDINISTGWDGTYQDKPVEIGTYTYMFELYYINGETEIRTGSVNVFR